METISTIEVIDIAEVKTPTNSTDNNQRYNTGKFT